MRSLHPKIIAIFLLLVFSQKLGLRLWMHHWFHETKTAQSSKFPCSEKKQVRCDCIDDALMPLTGSPFITVSITIQKYIVLLAAYNSPFSDTEELFYSLKGPPIPEKSIS